MKRPHLPPKLDKFLAENLSHSCLTSLSNQFSICTLQRKIPKIRTTVDIPRKGIAQPQSLQFPEKEYINGFRCSIMHFLSSAAGTGICVNCVGLLFLKPPSMLLSLCSDLCWLGARSRRSLSALFSMRVARCTSVSAVSQMMSLTGSFGSILIIRTRGLVWFGRMFLPHTDGERKCRVVCRDLKLSTSTLIC
jgi:hypothetical protein